MSKEPSDPIGGECVECGLRGMMTKIEGMVRHFLWLLKLAFTCPGAYALYRSIHTIKEGFPT
jgi:hypothetical protein